MVSLRGIREKILPERKRYRLFEDLGDLHDVNITIYTHPYRHAIIDNFLPQEAYRRIKEDLTELLKKGLATENDRGRFSYFELYDLYSYVPKPSLEKPYGYFFTESYFQMVESILRRSLSRETFATFHHHLPNLQDNYIHNDYSYEYFAHDPLSNGVNPWYLQCDKYKPTESSFPRIRGVAAILYINDKWRDGDGGETGIFSTKNTGSLVRKIAPIGNRLTLFDITPHSFHNYMRCALPMRDSLAQWFYSTEDDVRHRFSIKPGGWEHLYALHKKN